MSNAIFKVPTAINEPVKGYAPGSPEREELLAKYKEMYNQAPIWWKETSMPAKSGVGGIIMIVLPGIMGIGIVSPPLNSFGNSTRGVDTGRMLANIPIYK